MSKYTTVSVKVPREVKEKLKKHGIRPSEILKRAILDEIRAREIEDLERRADELEGELAKFSTEYVVKAIREDRDSR
ncbi:MAG: hypothetical protein ABC588_02825 [Candidatus Methanosuratincola petrocarbonis]